MNAPRKIAILSFVVALSGVTAAASPSGAAAANEFDAGAAWVSLIADQEPSAPLTFTVDGTSASCEDAEFESTSLVAMPNEVAHVHPYYLGDCTVFGFVDGVIETAGCHYLLHAGSTSTSSSTYDGSLDVICTEGSLIKIKGGTCEVQFGSQNGLEKVMYTNVGGSPSTVTIELDLSGIAVEKTTDGFLCPLKGVGTATATQVGDLDLEAYETSTQVSVEVQG